MSTQPRIYNLSFLYKIKITEDEIVGTYDFRSHRLMWHEITSVNPNLKGQGLILSNAGEDITIYINPNVPGYFEIVELIQKKLPDLWKNQDIQTFHYSSITPVYISLGGAALIYSVFTSGHPNPNWAISLTGVVVGLFLIGYAIRCRIKVFFNGDMIVVKYVFGERRIHAREIEAILTELPLIIQIRKKPIFSIILKNAMLLKLRNGKTFFLGNVKEDRSIFLSSLQKWAKTFLPGLTS